MNPTYFKKNEFLESARQARVRQMNLPPEELIKAKLAHFQSFVSQLEKTEYGRDDLRECAHGAAQSRQTKPIGSSTEGCGNG